MTSIYQLKSAFQKLLRPCSNWLAKHHITPNQITITALLLSMLTGVVIYLFSKDQWPFLLVSCALLVRMMLNALDGMIAREHHMQTALGTFLNELGDVFSDTFIYLPFSFVPNISFPLIISIVILAIISEMTGVVALQIGAKRRYDGPMGKSDRAFIFGVIALLLGLGIKPGIWLTIILSIVTILLIITIINRISKALQEIKYVKS